MKFNIYIATHELRPGFAYVGCRKGSMKNYKTRGWPRKLWKESGIRPVLNVFVSVDTDDTDDLPNILENELFQSLRTLGVPLDQQVPNRTANPFNGNTYGKSRASLGIHPFQDPDREMKWSKSLSDGRKLGAKNQPHEVRVAQGKRAGSIAHSSGQLDSIRAKGTEKSHASQLCVICHRVSSPCHWWRYKTCEHIIINY